VLIIDHSGELPEVAYHNSLYYLSEDIDGPGIELGENDLLALRMAVIRQYIRIIERDITTSNRDRRIYRGLERAWINWRRCQAFAEKYHIDLSEARDRILEKLRNFLMDEVDRIKSGKEYSLDINAGQLACFLKDLGCNDPYSDAIFTFLKEHSPD